MKQADLDRAVARATGETVSTIKRLGFRLAEPSDHFDSESDDRRPFVIDWDELDAQRHELAPRRPRYEPACA